MNEIVSLTDKVALVTDMASPLGYAIAETLVRAGSHVHGVNPNHDDCAQQVNSLKRWGKASGHVVDLRNGTAALQFAHLLNEEVPRLHVLVSNCRIASTGSMPELLGRGPAGWVGILGEMALIHEMLDTLRDAATVSDPTRVVLIGHFAERGQRRADAASEAASSEHFIGHAKDISTRMEAHRVNINFVELGSDQALSADDASLRPRVLSTLLAYLSSGAVRRTGEIG